MADGDGEEAQGSVSAREHLDNPLVFLLVIAFVVYGVGCFGRAVGNRFDVPGVTAFFGG